MTSKLPKTQTDYAKKTGAAKPQAYSIKRPKKGSLGWRVNQIHRKREKIRKLESALKEIKSDYERDRADLLREMSAQGIDQAAGTNATAYRKETTIYTVKDFLEFFNYVRRNNAPELLQNRVSQTAVRERIEGTRGKKLLPGLDTFDKVDVTVRSK